MPADSSIVTKINGDASPLIQALDKAVTAVGKFGDDTAKVLTKKFSGADLFRGLVQGLGIGTAQQIAEKIVEPFKEAAESAKLVEEATGKAADATERLIKLRQDDNQELATSVKQMQRLQNEIEILANSAPSKKFFGL